MRVRRFRDLPLALKLLLPYLVLGLIVGTVGTSLIVRQLSGQALSNLNQELRQRTLDQRAALHDRELYLLEAGNFAANIAGLSAATKSGDAVTVQRLAASVAALKADLGVIAVVDQSGRSLYSLSRAPGQRVFQAARPLSWTQEPVFQSALRSATGKSSAGFIRTPDSSLIAIATPICSSQQACAPAGVTVVALHAREVVNALAEATSGGRAFGVALLDATGREIARTGRFLPVGTPPADVESGNLRRLVSGKGSNELATLYAGFSLGGLPAGTLAVTQPAAPFLSGVRATSHRLLGVLLLTMIGIAVIGIVLARLILGQLRPLLAASRRLGAGELEARVDVRARDELGELAAGINDMAEQLESSYATLESRVDERTEEVHRLLKDRNEFFAGLSHELRTPIAVIAAQADLILTSRTQRKRVDPYQAAANVKDSAVQLLSVVNQILELARAEAGRLTLQMTEVGVAALLQGMKPAFDRLAGAAGIKPSVESATGLTVVADPLRLRHVLLNLIENAVKYTPSGGRVAIRARASDGGVEILVTDTGVGIPENAQDRVFEPFYQVEGNDAQHGEASSGLGLALAKRLIIAQGGSIRCESAVGKGSTFSIELPTPNTAELRPDAGRHAMNRLAPPSEERVPPGFVESVRFGVARSHDAR